MAKGAARQPDGSASLHGIAALLQEAMRVVTDLEGDAIIRKVLESFRLMPLEDRGVVAEALHREVQARRLSLATQDATGQAMHANPHARLYVRSHESVIPRSVLERDELMLALTSAMRLAPVLRTPAIHGELVEALALALDHVDSATRADVATLLEETLTIVRAHVS